MKKKLLIFIMLAIISLGGMVMVFSLNREIKADKAARIAQEEKRNREYEVSLVKALKNSYRDIEEIRLSDPEYSEIPGSWACTVELKFLNGDNIRYDIFHHLTEMTNYSGYMSGKTNEEIDSQWEKLYSYKGITKNKIKVRHSDNEVGEQ